MKKMYQSGTMDIQYLPIHILEEIFLKLSDRKVLRLVSKTFKNIVDKSPKLMDKYALNVEKCCKDKNCEVNAFYQYLNFEELNLEGYKFINNYQHKDRIKSIQIDFFDRHDIDKCAVMIQHILLNFDNLDQLMISDNSDDDEYNSEGYGRVDKLVENKHSKLISLEIVSYDPLFSNNIIELFADIKSIKKFKTYTFYRDFPIVKWELDELIIDNSESELDDKLAEIILSKQKPCLKVLKIYNLCDFANFVVHRFPNLEKLYLENCWESKLENEFLLPNDTLKVLKLSDSWCHITFIETILMHYRNIEVLEIRENYISYDDDDGNLSKKIKLHNLKRFTLKIDGRDKEDLKERHNIYLLNVETPNLKFLEIDMEPGQHLNELQIFGHVEHLDIHCIDNLENFLKFLQKFPTLKLLKMTKLDFNFDPSVMNTILQKAPTLKQIQISCESIKEHIVSFEEMRKQLNNENVNLTSF